MRLGLHNWYISRVRFLGVSAADKREVPTANYKVYYDKKITKETKLHGNVLRMNCRLKIRSESMVDSVREGLGTP